MALYDDFGIPMVQDAMGALDAQQRGIAKRVSDQFDNSREIYNREANRYSLPAMADFNRNWAVERAKAMAGYSQDKGIGDLFGLGNTGLGGTGAGGPAGGGYTGGGGGGGTGGRSGGGGGRNGGGYGGYDDGYGGYGGGGRAPRGSSFGPSNPRVTAPRERSSANNLGNILGLSRMLFGNDPTSGTRGYQDIGGLLYDLGLVDDPGVFARSGSRAERSLRNRGGYTPQQRAQMQALGIPVDDGQEYDAGAYGNNGTRDTSTDMIEGETQDEWACRVFGICGQIDNGQEYDAGSYGNNGGYYDDYSGDYFGGGGSGNGE